MKTDITFGQKEQGKTYTDRIGAYLLAEKDGKLAVVRTLKGYFLPGGGIEADETPEECLLRECTEELGCRCDSLQFFGSADDYLFHDRIGYFHPVQLYFTGNLDEQTMPPTESDHALVWLSPEFAEKHLFVPSQRWALQKYRKQS